MHLTSSAKIRSCGLVLTSASRESSRLRLVCLASVFWAPGRTWIRPLKTARERSVEDALVELVAGAVRLAMLDVHVVVDVLPAARQVEPVEDGVDALAVEHRAHVVAHQRRRRVTIE